MPTLEEITYDAGKTALADQESVVAGVRQRTGTQLAAHALVASFLATTGWLAAAGFGYQKLRTENANKVRLMSFLSGSLGVLVVVQTLAWLTALAIHS